VIGIRDLQQFVFYRLEAYF